jgi:hypothetical protein
MRCARSHLRSCKAAVIVLVMANAVALATLCVAAAPAWGDPPPWPEPSRTSTPVPNRSPAVIIPSAPAVGLSPVVTTSKSPGLRQTIARAIRSARGKARARFRTADQRYGGP